MDWATNPDAFVKFVREHQCPSFLEYGEYPYVSSDEIKKALKLRAAFSNMLDLMQWSSDATMLELDDIQHILLTRTPALNGVYAFLSFHNAAGGRAWLSAILERVSQPREVRVGVEREKRWVTVAFTWNGLRALGVDDASLDSFPEAFKQGMVARASILGDAG